MTSGIDHLMRQRLVKWERRRELAQEAAALAETQQPVIAISRESHSLGEAISEIVAARLGFDVYGRQLIEQIAQQAHVRQQVVESVGERLQQDITAWIDGQVDGGYFTSTDYLHHLSKVVLTLAQHGEAVIVGRGVQFILNPQRTLRLRTIAPRPVRVQRLCEAEHVSEREARARVLNIDAGRECYCRWHFNTDVADPQHYDLVLNTAFLSSEECANVVINAYKERFVR